MADSGHVKARTTGLRNTYQARCRDCGKTCPPDSGFLLEKEKGKAWTIACDQCHPEQVGATTAAEEKRRQEAREHAQWIHDQAEAARKQREAERIRREQQEDEDRLNSDPLYQSIKGIMDRLRREQGTPPCLATLGLTPPVTADQVNRAFRERSFKVHPDHGGSAAEFVALRKARDEAMAIAGGKAVRSWA